MLRLRILTAVIALIILLALLFTAPPAVLQMAIALVVIGGAWEWSGLLGVQQPVLRMLYVGLVVALLLIVHLGGVALVNAILLVAFVWW